MFNEKGEPITSPVQRALAVTETYVKLQEHGFPETAAALMRDIPFACDNKLPEKIHIPQIITDLVTGKDSDKLLNSLSPEDQSTVSKALLARFKLLLAPPDSQLFFVHCAIETLDSGEVKTRLKAASKELQDSGKLSSPPQAIMEIARLSTQLPINSTFT